MECLIRGQEFHISRYIVANDMKSVVGVNWEINFRVSLKTEYKWKEVRNANLNLLNVIFNFVEIVTKRGRVQ